MNKRGFLLSCVAGLSIVAVPALAGSNDWVSLPRKSFPVKVLQVENLNGALSIDVADGGPVQLDVKGLQWKVDRLRIETRGDVLRIKDQPEGKVWDWHNWLNFNNNDAESSKKLNVRIVIPRGMAVRVKGIVGPASIGNTYGPLTFEAEGSSESRIGSVANAEVSSAGSGRIFVGDVAGSLHAEVAGSGNIRTGNAGALHAEIAGSGNIAVGSVATQSHIEIAGSGDVNVAAVRGPTHVEIAGSGSANIADGVADPFHVEIVGSGDVTFCGTAVNPFIEAMGSGRVKLKAYRGTLRKEGQAAVSVGN